jgi:hypothetical protein
MARTGGQQMTQSFLVKINSPSQIYPEDIEKALFRDPCLEVMESEAIEVDEEAETQLDLFTSDENI